MKTFQNVVELMMKRGKGASEVGAVQLYGGRGQTKRRDTGAKVLIW